MSNNTISVNDPQITVFAQSTNNNLISGFTRHPRADRIMDHVGIMVRGIRADGKTKAFQPSDEIIERIRVWKDKGYKIWVKASHRDAILAWDPTRV